jgi:hypothetical protein
MMLELKPQCTCATDNGYDCCPRRCEARRAVVEAPSGPAACSMLRRGCDRSWSMVANGELFRPGDRNVEAFERQELGEVGQLDCQQLAVPAGIFRDLVSARGKRAALRRHQRVPRSRLARRRLSICSQPARNLTHPDERSMSTLLACRPHLY